MTTAQATRTKVVNALADLRESAMALADLLMDGCRALSTRTKMRWNDAGTVVRAERSRLNFGNWRMVTHAGLPYRVMEIGQTGAYVVLDRELWVICTRDGTWVFPNVVAARYAAEAAANDVLTPMFGEMAAEVAWQLLAGDEGGSLSFGLRTDMTGEVTHIVTVGLSDCVCATIFHSPDLSGVEDVLAGQMAEMLQRHLTKLAKPLQEQLLAHRDEQTELFLEGVRGQMAQRRTATSRH